MLLELRIENLGIIEELAVVVQRGLSAITGETGAGKTLVVEALELLAGARADSALVRPGTPEARVEGRFEDPLTGDEIVVARAVPADGRSRAYIDGRLATAGELADLGARLIDLHGQHTHQSLLAPAMQRAVLDTFAGAPALEARAEYQAGRQEMRDIDAAMQDLGGDERARAREMSLLQYEIDEIDAAGLGAPDADGRDEDARLEAEEDALGDAVANREALTAAHASVDGAGAEAIGIAASSLADRAPFVQLEERARALQAELAELAHDLRVAAESVIEDPERLDQVRERRRRLRELQRKYGDTLGGRRGPPPRVGRAAGRARGVRGAHRRARGATGAGRDVGDRGRGTPPRRAHGGRRCAGRGGAGAAPAARDGGGGSRDHRRVGRAGGGRDRSGRLRAGRQSG